MEKIFIVFFCAVATCMVSAGVEVSIYQIDVEQFNEAKESFAEVVGDEASKNCSDVSQISPCPAAFTKENLTAVLSGVEYVKPNVNVTITIVAATGEKLPNTKTDTFIQSARDSIYDKTDLQITGTKTKFIGIKPDDPANWIIISIFSVLTLVFFLVVVYLSKHKVNHAEEHIHMKVSPSDSVDGEIAT